jgi:hypothetical protein
VSKSLTFALILASTPALAQQHPQALGVWDHTGQFVGDYVWRGGFSSALLTYNDETALFPFDYAGLRQGAATQLYYTTANCSGTPYIDASDQPPFGFLDNNTYYFPSPGAQFITPVSRFVGAPPVCAPYSLGEIYAAPAQSVTYPANKFTPPFCVSASKVKCAL